MTEYELREDGQILSVEQIRTHTIGTHHTWSLHIIASYQDGSLRAEWRRPVIEGTEWQGQLVEAEQRPMLLSVDGSEPVEIAVASGVAEVPLTFEYPGTYLVKVFAEGFGATPAEIEVVVE